MRERARPAAKIAVLGAGNMGTALAQVLARNGHGVTMWDVFPEVVEDVYAILLGSLSELSGDSRNLEAAALTASLREMADIASAHGGRRDTLHGLAGLGDLVRCSPPVQRPRKLKKRTAGCRKGRARPRPPARSQGKGE